MSEGFNEITCQRVVGQQQHRQHQVADGVAERLAVAGKPGINQRKSGSWLNGELPDVVQPAGASAPL